ncbi:hypothetical protein CSB37_03365 [bacterium DOLZORAL124_38_8]|nr:MAG: hypothetical protein CSB37_03365 [bacterium DOLZORAL124_38_8]
MSEIINGFRVDEVPIDEQGSHHISVDYDGGFMKRINESWEKFMKEYSFSKMFDEPRVDPDFINYPESPHDRIMMMLPEEDDLQL